MRTRDGTPLSVSHIVQLATLADEADRQAWLEALGHNGWKARELKAQMQSRRDKPQRDRGAGRRMREPADLGQGLGQVLAWTRDWLRRYERVWGGEASPKWQEEAGTSDAEVDRLLAEAAGELSRLRRAADRLVERLEGIAARLPRQARRKEATTGVRRVRKPD